MESRINIGKGKSVFDKKPLGERLGNKDVFKKFFNFSQAINKKVKANPKYADVKSVINHGKTMKDVQVISDNLVAKKKGENFGRIKASTLAKFLSEINNEESVFGLMQNADDAEKENFDVQSTTGSVMSIGGQSIVTCTTDMLGITSETKFILLDLRDEEEYKQFHIKEAISFPAPNISRDKIFS